MNAGHFFIEFKVEETSMGAKSCVEFVLFLFTVYVSPYTFLEISG